MKSEILNKEKSVDTLAHSQYLKDTVHGLEQSERKENKRLDAIMRAIMRTNRKHYKKIIQSANEIRLSL